MRPVKVHQRDGRYLLGRLIDAAPAEGALIPFECWSLHASDAAWDAYVNASRPCELMDAAGTVTARGEGRSLPGWRASTSDGRGYHRAAIRVLPLGDA